MLKGIMSYGLVEAVSKGLNWSLMLCIPALVGQDVYGLIGVLVAIELIGPALSGLAFDRALLRLVEVKENNKLTILTSKSLEETRAILSWNILTNVLVLGLVISIIFVFEIDYIFGLSSIIFSVLTFLTLLFTTTISQLLSVFRKLNSFYEYTKLRLTFQFLKTTFVLILLIFIKNPEMYFFGVIFSGFLSLLIWVKSYRKFFILSFKRETLLSYLKFSWPLVFHVLAANLISYGDRLVLELNVSKPELGLYTLAYTVGGSVGFIFQAIGVYFEPKVYSAATKEGGELLLLRSLVLSVLGGVVTFYFIYYLIYLGWIPAAYNQYKDGLLNVVPIIALGQLFYPFYFNGNYRLVNNFKVKSVAFISVLIAILNLVLNIIFIPFYGIYAASYITLISGFVLSTSVFIKSLLDADNLKNWKHLLLLLPLLSILLLGYSFIFGFISCLFNLSLYIWIYLNANQNLNKV